MPWITRDDFVETYAKLKQRGFSFFLSKLNINPTKRTKSTFDDPKLEAANWWIIPDIQKRWNQIITNSPDLRYEDYFVNKYLKDRKEIKLLSIGSGISNHEIYLAKYDVFKKIDCLDITSELLAVAEKKARNLGLENINFINAKLDDFKIEKGDYDVIMFHQSLHHFKNTENLLEKIASFLDQDGLLLLHEYVGPNRLIWRKEQLSTSNKCLLQIPKKYRLRFKTGMTKHKITGPGSLRMILSDPSEAVDSESILPALQKHFQTVEEKNLGGNLLCLILKDIAHHFVDKKEETQIIIKSLFLAEDDFIEQNQSDMIFGVYRPG